MDPDAAGEKNIRICIAPGKKLLPDRTPLIRIRSGVANKVFQGKVVVFSYKIF
jgi:hypothetical protein